MALLLLSCSGIMGVPQSESILPEIGERALREILGYRLRRARVERDLTQDKLAKRVQMSRASLANIESGRQTISAYALYRLATELDIALPDFFAQNLELPPDLPPLVRDWIEKEASSP
jgi:transcriptional regulator with XRE-family HTH domain